MGSGREKLLWGTGLRSGAGCRRRCPRERLQRQERRSFLLRQHSHRGLENPGREAALPSKTKRKKEGGEGEKIEERKDTRSVWRTESG